MAFPGSTGSTAFPDSTDSIAHSGSTPSSGSLRASTDGDNVVLASGEIDLLTAPTLWEALARVIERGHRQVVLDLAGVEFIDSQGIAVIMRAHKRVQPEGGTVIIRSPHPQARNVLAVTGLTDLVQLED